MSLQTAAAAVGALHAINCNNIQVGTTEDLSDVVRDGVIRAEYSSAEFQHSQSLPHTYYIRGLDDAKLDGSPIVHSVRNNSHSGPTAADGLVAFTQMTNSNDKMFKVEVNYSDKNCQGEQELMQMDINLVGDCPTLSPQWYVKCDNTAEGAG